MSSKGNHDVLKSELCRRDETIQKLRRDVLLLQEKRDAHLAEVRPLATSTAMHQPVLSDFSVCYG